MRAKTLILLFVALGCGMIAAVAVSKVVMDKNPGEPTAEATVEIFVALKDLSAASRISAENVKLEKWPKSRVPEGALYRLDQLEDKYTRQNIFANEPILDRKISDSRASFAGVVPQGYRIFDIACKASYIKAGDHVDIIGTFIPGGRGSIPESRTVMRNVIVCGVNGNATRDSDEEMNGPVRDTVFQLQVKESQIEALTLANSMGQLQLNLRPFSEDEYEREDTGEDFMNWVTQQGKAKQELEAVKVVATEPTKPLVTKQLMIVTPDGVTTYEYSNENEIPRPVSTGDGNSSSSYQDVYSGYTEDPPTYATSTEPSSSQEAGAPQANGESESEAAKSPKEELGVN